MLQLKLRAVQGNHVKMIFFCQNLVSYLIKKFLLVIRTHETGFFVKEKSTTKKKQKRGKYTTLYGNNNKSV